MPRILVIGNSGSGKTTLASRISNLFDIPHIELDAIFHQANWSPLDDDAFRERVQTETLQTDWVVCGNYSIVRDIIWERAETIIAIDLPRWKNMWRIVRRTARRAIRREELWNNNRESLKDVFVVPDLLQYDEVWAAAGTWNDNFGAAPADIVRVAGGVVTDLKRG